MQDVRKDRDKYIGGSDIPIIMGLSPFGTRWSLLQKKVGITKPDFDGNEYTRYGEVMEPKIRDYFNSSYNCECVEDKIIDGRLRYHYDGLDRENCVAIEIKTTSQIHDTLTGYKRYLVQLLTGMKLAGVKEGYLLVYERPEDFDEEFDTKKMQTFAINISDHDTLLEEINFAIGGFIEDWDRLKENPFLTEEDLQPFELVALSDEVVRLENSLAAYKQIETEAKDVKIKLKEAMEKHGIKKWTTNGGVKITLVPDGADSVKWVFDEKRFKIAQPEAYEKYLIDKPVKGRSGYVKITLPK